MSIYNFVRNGQSFAMKAPTGMTEEQARAIFDQQATSGSLVGIKVGAAVSAATQASGGLPGAAAQLSQSAASITGALPAGVNLNSITASIGAAGQAAAGQVSKSLQGGAAAFNSLTTGASGATTDISRALSTGTSGTLTSALTGAAALPGSLANQTVNTVSKVVNSATPLNGINVADLAKQGVALGKIGNLNQAAVTGTLAAAAKTIGQPAAAISNSLGAGKFGFDAAQLERAGLVKPGTAAAFLAQGQNDLVSVLKSPTVWTGKDGVKSLTNLLGNSTLQDKVQQGLMKTGLNDLKAAGIPTDKLSPPALAGLATNAAKSVPATLDWAKNSPALPPAAKSLFNTAAIGGAFAVALTSKKVDSPVLQQTKPEPAENTVNSETQDAAGQRVVGNDKVPEVAASSTGADAKAKITAFLNFISNISSSASGVNRTVTQYESEPTITLEQWNTVNDEWQVIKATFNTKSGDLANAARAAVDQLPRGIERNIYVKFFNRAAELSERLAELGSELGRRIKNLASKIQGAGEIPV